MAPGAGDVEPSIFKYILRYSLRQQITLLIMTGVSFPFLYYSLDLPKRIINQAIGGQDFPQMVFGMPFEQVPFLMLLCTVFLALVLINGGFKYWINVYKGQVGERMLRRLRYQLFARVLRFPLPQFRKMSQGEIIAMITTEVEPLGGFIGDAFAQPAYRGGTLITILAFMFVQDWILGLAAIALYPVQMYLIPKLQKRVNDLAKQRVRTVRKLSERIGESVSSIHEIHAHDTSELERADFAHRVGAIFEIRFRIYKLKFFIKFLNNFIAMVTPFFFFSVGGYLVIEGDLTFGALVAVLAAYKDLSAPWKELLMYYQQMEDARIKYDLLTEQFEPADMLDEALQQPEPGPVPPLDGTVVAVNVTLEEEAGIKVIDGASFSFAADSRVAIVGPSGSGHEGVAKVLARLLRPTSGTLRIGEHNLAALSEAAAGRRIAYAGPTAALFSGSIADNLLYGLKHRPVAEAERDAEAARGRERFVSEAEAAGNTTADLEADWIDYEAAGVSGPEALDERVQEVLSITDLEADVYDFGLQGAIDPAAFPELAAGILEARSVLRGRLADPALADLVEPFDRARYNSNMSVAENLLFGTPIGDAFDLEHLGENPYVLSVLGKAGLAEDFLTTGLKVATITVEMFQGLPPEHEFFDRYSFISADELPDYQHCVRRYEAGGLDALEETDRATLTSLPFKLIPARHRLGVIDEPMQERLLAARRLFAEELPESLKGSVAFFDDTQYNAAAAVQDNILFGKIVYGRQTGLREVGRLIGDVVRELDLRRTIVAAGLATQVGVGGSRLSVAQRQKVVLARCVLKRPDILIVDQATAAMDPVTHNKIMENLFEECRGRGLVWVLGAAEQARRFDRAVVMEGGKVVEQGPVGELDQPGSLLRRLAAE